MSACVTNPDKTPVNVGPFAAHAVFIVNEGNTKSLATLDCYEPEALKYSEDIYRAMNGTALGDDATDAIVGGKDSLYVVEFNSTTIQLINRTSGLLLRTYFMGGCGPEKMVMMNDSQMAVTGANTNQVLVLNTRTGNIDARLSVGAYPIFMQRFGDVLFVGASGGSELDIVRLSNASVSKMDVGNAPGQVMVMNDSSAAVICSGTYGVANTASLRFFDPKTSMITGILSMPGGPFKLARDGNLLYVPCDSIVLRVDYTTHAVVDTFIASAAHIATYGIAVDSVTHTVYLSDAKDYSQRGTLSVYNGLTKSLITQMPCGISPGTILVTH